MWFLAKLGTDVLAGVAVVVPVPVPVLIPICPLPIFGFGPVPALGVVGGAWALVAYYAIGTPVLAGYCAGERNAAKLRTAPRPDSKHP